MENKDKVPPQAVDLEEAVLGCCLTGDREAVETMRLVIPDRDCFYKPSHQTVYDAIIHLSNSGEAIDLLTVVKRLKDTHYLDGLGGVQYISTLANKAGFNVEYHSRIIVQQWLRRKQINLAAKWYNDGFDDTADVLHSYDTMAVKVMATLETAISSGKQSVVHIAEPVKQSIAEYEERARAKGALTGITSGINALDRVTHGWQKSDLIIVAARPAMGKTALVLGFAEAAAEAAAPVAFFSLEMSKTQLVNRMIVGKSQVNVERFKRGTLSDVEVQEMIKATYVINELPIYIDDTPALTLANFARAARRLKKEKGIGLIVVDYLQLMDAEIKGNREQSISTISRGLKAVAKELNVPVIALSQLSRAVETRGGDKRPQLSDLRESGAIEQDADMVMFIHRNEYYGIMTYEDGESTQGMGELIIAKHRNGAIDNVEVKYIASQTKFTDLQPEPMQYNSAAGLTPNTNFYEQNKDVEDLPF
jgi:replicative DNA helicase